MKVDIHASITLHTEITYPRNSKDIINREHTTFIVNVLKRYANDLKRNDGVDNIERARGHAWFMAGSQHAGSERLIQA